METKQEPNEQAILGWIEETRKPRPVELRLDGLESSTREMKANLDGIRSRMVENQHEIRSRLIRIEANQAVILHHVKQARYAAYAIALLLLFKAIWG